MGLIFVHAQNNFELYAAARAAKQRHDGVNFLINKMYRRCTGAANGEKLSGVFVRIREAFNFNY